VRPQLDVRSDWTNHAVDLRAGTTIGRHADETDEDFNDFSVGASGRLDITGQSNLRGDVSYHQALQREGLLRGERFNLDFHAIPHRGEEAVLEKHYVSKRSRWERSVLVFLVQDSDSHVLCYSNATVNKHGQAEAILRFVEFWQAQPGQLPPLLIFDSQLTTYRVLD
jgi:hypothetical protein